MDYKSIMLGEKTPTLKILMLYDSPDTTFSKWQNYRHMKQTSSCQGLVMQVKSVGMTIKGQHEKVLRGNRTVQYPNCGGGYTNLYMV